MSKLISFILIILFIPLSLLVSIGFVMHQTLLSVDFLKQGFVQSGIYEAIFDPDLVPEIVERIQGDQGKEEIMDSSTLGEESFDIDPQIITTAAVRVQKALEEEFGPAYIQSKVEPFFDSFYTWMLGETEQLQLIIEIDADLADRVITVFKNTARETLQEFPTCESEEAFLQQTNITCFPPGTDSALIEGFITQYTSQFDESVRTIIPKQIDYATAIRESEIYADLLLARAVIQIIRELFYWLVLTVVVLLSLIAYLNRNGRYTKWVGITLLLGFLVPFLTSVMLELIGERAYTDVVVAQLSATEEIPFILQDVVGQVGYFILSSMGKALLQISTPPFVVGLLLLLIPSNKIPRFKKDLPVATPVAKE